MTNPLEPFRGVAHPWLCDAMGHMNTRHHAAMFDDASLHALAQLGYCFAWLEERRQGWADVRLELEFKNEVKVNSLIRISSAVEKVGRTSLVLLHQMEDAETLELLSTMRSVTVYFDLQARKAIELPETIRQAAQARLVD